MLDAGRRWPRLLPEENPDDDWVSRVLVLIGNRLTRPCSEHALAGWLETDYVCDRSGRRYVPYWKQQGRVQVDLAQLQRWYRTLDHLLLNKEKIEVALYKRLRNLFEFETELVFYDLTSTYFEGHGPATLAKHGYSRDGKPRKVQVVVGMTRRRNPEAEALIDRVDHEKWIECSMGITAREKKAPPRTRVQEVQSDREGVRVFVVDSDERRAYEERQPG